MIGFLCCSINLGRLYQGKYVPPDRVDGLLPVQEQEEAPEAAAAAAATADDDALTQQTHDIELLDLD
jgi:hypothetical protein